MCYYASRHIPSTLLPVMFKDMRYFNWFTVEHGAIQKTALAQDQQAESVASSLLDPLANCSVDYSAFGPSALCTSPTHYSLSLAIGP